VEVGWTTFKERMHSPERVRLLGSVIIACAAALGAPHAVAQVPARPTPAPPAGRGERAPDYPERPAAPPEQIAHGQQLFSGNCSFCHGSDARGGEKGPNLVRAQVVLDDRHGELITPIVQNGIPAQGMPKFALSETDIADIAAWLHVQPLSDRGTPSSLDIVVGNARDGETFFNGAGHCTQCHSVTGDLAGIGGAHDPKAIQNLIVSGGGGRSFGRRSARAAPPPKLPQPTVTVTFPSGRIVQGALDHISAFVVALREPDGTYRSFARQGSIPKVVVTNPLQWHVDRLPQWRDADIHNLTAYLLTVK
jgi:cytochrome c oxidase cbb3-type subunit III